MNWMYNPSGKFISVVILFSFLASGCAVSGYREMTKEEAVEAATRYFKGVTRPQVLDASQKVLELFDGSNFMFSREGSKLIGTRRFPNMPLTRQRRQYTDTWRVVALQKGEGIIATVYLERSSPEIGVGAYTRSPRGPAAYYLFWKRMDYQLGQSSQWFTCHDLRMAIDRGETWGETTWLCELTRDDLPPELKKG